MIKEIQIMFLLCWFNKHLNQRILYSNEMCFIELNL